MLSLFARAACASRAACARRAFSTGVWDEPGSYHHPEGTPDGFTLRTPSCAKPVDVMMEKWEAGTAEPIHSHVRYVSSLRSQPFPRQFHACTTRHALC